VGQPTALAKAMVDGGGAAEIANCNGRIRSVRLLAAASSHAERIGSPAMAPPGARGSRSARCWRKAARASGNITRSCTYE
jgi:hypothetical protein